MRFVLTIAAPEGSFADVGMSGRFPLNYATVKGATARARAISRSNNRPVRVEGFTPLQWYNNQPPSVHLIIDNRG